LAIDLLGKLLVFDPKERIDCVKALEHPWFEVWHDEADEPGCEKVRTLFISRITFF
jgi:serine/threonine protein kinase